MPSAPVMPAAPEPKPSPAAKASRWWHLHWTSPLFSVVTAVGAAALPAAAFIGVQVSQVAAPAATAAPERTHRFPGRSVILRCPSQSEIGPLPGRAVMTAIDETRRPH